MILTGAGISAESGVDTFRDKDGIWSKVDYRDVATPEGFARDPDLVHDFYNRRRRGLAGAEPNAAHRALGRLEQGFLGDLVIVTQNIDDLHERAGSRGVIHIHGELRKSLCAKCGDRRRHDGDLTVEMTCQACHTPGHLRPDVVWFGEMPCHMDAIEAALAGCDLFVSIGTSGNVYPAAGFVEVARDAGARTLELNLEPSQGATLFDKAIHGRASEIVPAFVDDILSGRS